MTPTDSMDKHEITALLQHFSIRPTANRILLTQELIRQHGPASQKELEQKLMTIDKSVVSRTLTLMQQHGLVHSFPSPTGIELYELCYVGNENEREENEHAHFYCLQCGRARCLHDMEMPHIVLPKGFLSQHTSFVITGLCARCHSMAKHD